MNRIAEACRTSDILPEVLRDGVPSPSALYDALRQARRRFVLWNHQKSNRPVRCDELAARHVGREGSGEAPERDELSLTVPQRPTGRTVMTTDVSVNRKR